MTVGYSKPLYILAFDHRASFTEHLLGVTAEPTPEQAEVVSGYKDVIFEGLLKAIKGRVPRASCAVLVDEQYGDKVLTEAKAHKITRILTVEKSGQKELCFEYGMQFGWHVEKYGPEFVKALVRYNVAGDGEVNRRQRAQLKTLSDYCHQKGFGLLVEPLVEPTQRQLLMAEGDRTRFDEEQRAVLTVQMMEEMQRDGIEVDVWKIEGFHNVQSYQLVVLQAHSGGRNDVGVVVLGRAEKPEVVASWLTAGSQVRGVTGFAVGRTIFWEPLEALHKGAIKREQAVDQIAERYTGFYKIFTGK